MKFRVLHEYWDDEGWTCDARLAEDAALKFAEHFETHYDGSLLNGSTEDVTVVDPHGNRTRWRLSAELVAHYSARSVDPITPPSEEKP